MMDPFDGFVAVDWSGAKGRNYAGVAVARCGPGKDAPALVDAPRGSHWRRSDFVEWLMAEAAADKRLLVGIDCNFALPEPAGRAIMGGEYAATDLWQRIDGLCADSEDFYGGGLAKHADYAHLFWHSGKRPSAFEEHRRATEKACHRLEFGTPESPLKLLGPKQVGKSGLAGMRVLTALKCRLGSDFAVWPFDPSDDVPIVCVEIYPRLFIRRGEHGNRKLFEATLSNCLDKLGSKPYVSSVKLTDHQTDALISAAGMRARADYDETWTPPGLDALARRAEGWIFGVA